MRKHRATNASRASVDASPAFDRARKALAEGRVVVLTAGDAGRPDDEEACRLAHDPRFASVVELIEAGGTDGSSPTTVVLVPPGHLAAQDLEPGAAHRFEEMLEHIDPYCRLVEGCCASHENGNED